MTTITKGTAINLTRRSFLQVSAVVGGGLLFSIFLPTKPLAAQALPSAGIDEIIAAAVTGNRTPLVDETVASASAETSVTVGVWVRIDPDESVTILVPTAEMGQGVLTSLAQILAEELKVDWHKVRTMHAPEGAAWGSRLTGGSTSVRTRYTLLRRAGAAARDLLIRAAAQSWGIDPTLCQAAHGQVTRTDTSASLTYGQLAPLAATLTPATDPAYLDSLLTPDAQMQVIGKSVPRPDLPSKVDGSAIYGIDVRLPNMLYAAVRHCPAIGGVLKSVPPKPTGVVAVVPLKNAAGVFNAVAVVATDTWAAMRAAKELSVRWTVPATSIAINSTAIMAQAQTLMAAGTPVIAENSLNGAPSTDPLAVEAALAAATNRYELTYDLPYVAHATFEVLNCTALVTESGGAVTGCQIWAPTQWVTVCETTGATVTGLPQGAIKVTNTLLGSGLGRKFEADFISQAVQIANTPALRNRPVKLTWSREEDFGNDRYRPMALSRVRVGVDGAGHITAWDNRIVTPGILYQRGTPLDRVDSQAVEGAWHLPYQMGTRRVGHVQHPAPVPLGFWRSVGSSINTFVVESAVDEVAKAVGSDPYQYRRQMLATQPRQLRVLDTAAQMAGWGTRALLAGRALGIAIAESFGTIVCEVVELSAPAANSVKVHRVWCAVDCGKAINPDTIKQQIEGGMALGLSTALWSKITWLKGATVEKNFNKSRKLLLREMPLCDVTILETPDAPLGGIGKPGTPPIAAAVANAYAKLTGVRLRSLPLFPTQSQMSERLIAAAENDNADLLSSEPSVEADSDVDLLQDGVEVQYELFLPLTVR